MVRRWYASLSPDTPTLRAHAYGLLRAIEMLKSRLPSADSPKARRVPATIDSCRPQHALTLRHKSHHRTGRSLGLVVTGCRTASLVGPSARQSDKRNVLSCRVEVATPA